MCLPRDGMPFIESRGPVQNDHSVRHRKPDPSSRSLPRSAGLRALLLCREADQEHVERACVAWDLRVLHELDPPVSEDSEGDFFTDVFANPRSAQRRTQQKLAARPEHAAQFRRVARAVFRGEVVEAAPVQAGCRGCLTS
jgi:hypothetical protein